jgi:hypothetical protein
MRMDIVMGECRPAGKLSNEEIQLSLDNAKVLLELRPPLRLCIILSMYISELLREVNKRPDFEFAQRDIADFPDRDIAKAIGYAEALRSVNPRLGVQVAMSEYQINLMTEQGRRKAARKRPRGPLP